MMITSICCKSLEKTGAKIKSYMHFSKHSNLMSRTCRSRSQNKLDKWRYFQLNYILYCTFRRSCQVPCTLNLLKLLVESVIVIKTSGTESNVKHTIVFDFGFLNLSIIGLQMIMKILEKRLILKNTVTLGWSRPSGWRREDDLAKNMCIYDDCALNVDLHSRALLSNKRFTKSTQLNIAIGYRLWHLGWQYFHNRDQH